MKNTYPLERDEILVPTSQGYRQYPLMVLLGLNYSSLAGRRGFGMGKVRFLTNSSPYQNGQSVQGLRWETRQIQVLIHDHQKSLWDYWRQRATYLELLRPTRSTITDDKLIDPFIYRKWLPNSHLVRGTDMQVTNGSSYVFTPSGGFVCAGGLEAGDHIFINSVDYQIASAPNDAELILTTNYSGATSSTASWKYTSKQVSREISFILAGGLAFDQDPSSAVVPHGFQEVLRLTCHDPLWRGREQQRSWSIPDSYGDLVFDGEGAWFGVQGSTGRVIFNPDYISETATVYYCAHDIARPTIVIRGPAHYPGITNLTTGIGLNLEYLIDEGEEVVIDIDTLSVTNNRGDNLLGYLRGNLSGFGLVPEPAAPSGANDISITFGGATEASLATLKWRNVYAGI